MGHVGVTHIVQHVRRQLGVEGDDAFAWAAGAADARAVLGALPVHQLLQRQLLSNSEASRRGLHALRDVVQVRTNRGSTTTEAFFSTGAANAVPARHHRHVRAACRPGSSCEHDSLIGEGGGHHGMCAPAG